MALGGLGLPPALPWRAAPRRALPFGVLNPTKTPTPALLSSGGGRTGGPGREKARWRRDEEEEEELERQEGCFPAPLQLPVTQAGNSQPGAAQERSHPPRDPSRSRAGTPGAGSAQRVRAGGRRSPPRAAGLGAGGARPRLRAPAAPPQARPRPLPGVGAAGGDLVWGLFSLFYRVLGSFLVARVAASWPVSRLASKVPMLASATATRRLVAQGLLGFCFLGCPPAGWGQKKSCISSPCIKVAVPWVFRH